MANEPVQKGAAADGRGIVLWVPAIANVHAPTKDELNAQTVKRITYGLTPDGFQHEVTVNEIPIGRYTLDQELSLEGTKKHKVTLTYVYNRAEPHDTQTVLGTRGQEGYLVHALGYENDHTFDDGDVINAIIPVRIATSVDVPPTSNTELAKRQVPEIIGEVAQEVVVGGVTSS